MDGRKTFEYAVIIPTHGRADNVKTVQTLKRGGYTGRIYILLDDEDEQEQDYRRIYGDAVVTFCKSEWMEKTDTIDNFRTRGVVVYARNAVFDVAEKLGLEYFLVLDDDYSSFRHRAAEGKTLRGYNGRDLDEVFQAMFDFLEVSGALAVTFAQGGDFIGGVVGNKFYWEGIKRRKAMNTWFLKTDRRFDFSGTINEDTTATIRHGATGGLFFTYPKFCVTQTQTQLAEGGLTGAYLDLGTYVKSFYSVIARPDCVTVAPMGGKHYRMHHSVSWRHAVPMIIRESLRKGVVGG